MNEWKASIQKMIDWIEINIENKPSLLEMLLDIAVKYGYSSQETLTRAFVSAYGLTPLTYRKSPKPIKLSLKQNVISPEDYVNNGGISMGNIKEANMRFELSLHQIILYSFIRHLSIYPKIVR